MDKLTANKKRWVERLMHLGIFASLMITLVLARPLYDLYLSVAYPKTPLHGTWVEQGVAGYSAHSFTLSAKGVKMNGRFVGTEFSFDGKYVEYQVGNAVRRFKMLNTDYTEMKLISANHYQPVYRLSEKFKNNMR